mgnify:CR=1 FL=1
MKIYHFGAEDAPVLLLLPGTCCHWKSNFGAVIPLLADSFRVLCVSYDGFDETEQTEFPTMLEETEKIEAYLKTHCGGHIRAAYGCSLGGSFVGLLAARQNIHMDCGILGSSDLDQASPLAARLQTDFLLPLIYPVVRDSGLRNPTECAFPALQTSRANGRTANCRRTCPHPNSTRRESHVWRNRAESNATAGASNMPQALPD